MNTAKRGRVAPDAPTEEYELPQHGGSFVRDPATGKLECVEMTEPAEIRADGGDTAASEAADDPAGTTDTDAPATGAEQQQEG